jgi:hypothetical protein
MGWNSHLWVRHFGGVAPNTLDAFKRLKKTEVFDGKQNPASAVIDLSRLGITGEEFDGSSPSHKDAYAYFRLI